MPTRLERWMRSKLSAMTAFTPSSSVPLAAQSRDEPVPYSLPATITSGTPSLWYFDGGVVDRHLRAVGHVPGDAALGARRHLVLEPDVGEGAAHHHLVIAAARAVGVEVDGADAVADEIAAGRALLLDRAGGRDVIGGDAVAEQAEQPRAADVADRARLARQARRSRAGAGRRWRRHPTDR